MINENSMKERALQTLILEKTGVLFDIPEPIGESGYALPKLEGLCWKKLQVGENNWAIGEASDHFNFDIGTDCKNNIFLFSEESQCHGRAYVRGSNNVAIVIGSRTHRSPINIHFHSSYHVFLFGRDSTSNTATFEMGTDRTSIIVGEDCMFSAFINVSTDDCHAILDLNTGRHLNPAGSILFEPHIWIGMHCMILKNVKLGFGSIVGAGSVVTRNVPRKVAMAGNPARIVKTNISWTRNRYPAEDSAKNLADQEMSLISTKTFGISGE